MNKKKKTREEKSSNKNYETHVRLITCSNITLRKRSRKKRENAIAVVVWPSRGQSVNHSTNQITCDNYFFYEKFR